MFKRWTSVISVREAFSWEAVGMALVWVAAFLFDIAAIGYMFYEAIFGWTK